MDNRTTTQLGPSNEHIDRAKRGQANIVAQSNMVRVTRYFENHWVLLGPVLDSTDCCKDNDLVVPQMKFTKIPHLGTLHGKACPPLGSAMAPHKMSGEARLVAYQSRLHFHSKIWICSSDIKTAFGWCLVSASKEYGSTSQPSLFSATKSHQPQPTIPNIGEIKHV